MNENKGLIDLRERFNKKINANFLNEISATPVINPGNEKIYLHNNFGICT